MSAVQVSNTQTTRSLCAISKVTDLTTCRIVYLNDCWDAALCPAALWQEPFAVAAFPSSQDGMKGMTIPVQTALHLPPAAPWHSLKSLGSCPLPKQLFGYVCPDASCCFLSNCHLNKQQHTPQQFFPYFIQIMDKRYKRESEFHNEGTSENLHFT